MMTNFEYNKHICEYIRRHGLDQLHIVHLKSLKWLYDNLQPGRDFTWIGSHAGSRGGKSILIVQEYVWFANEDDLVAFRLATGL
jgi:hypothetical protein